MKAEKPSIDTERDGIETAILLALHAKNKGKFRQSVAKSGKAGGWSRLEAGMEIFCPRKPEFPRDMLALDPADEGRLYSVSIDDLVVSPVKAIGRGLEVGMLCQDGTLKWTLIKPMPSPRGLAAITNRPVDWFAVHFRTIRDGRREEYVRRPMPISDGRVVAAKALGWKGYDSLRDRQEMEEQLALMLSVFEDANRHGSVLATVEESVRLTFPVGDDAYRSFFALRDGLRDTPTGRRNPILHWCRDHIRRTRKRLAEVSGHERGRAELVHGNMRLTLQRSEGYSSLLTTPEASHGE